MSEYLNKIIEVASNPPVKAKRALYRTPSESALVASAKKQARGILSALPEVRSARPDTIDIIIAREKEENASEGTMARAVMAFASTLENPHTNTPTKHTDLLPANHPLSTDWISVFKVRKATAQYFAAEHEDEELSSLVASAIQADPDAQTRQRQFFVELIRERAQEKAPSIVANVTFADVVSTPMIALYSKDHNMTGIMITASHNPYHDNGIKVFDKGYKTTEEAESIIETFIDSGELSYEAPYGTLNYSDDVSKHYINFYEQLKI
jgi:hypothetical protein